MIWLYLSHIINSNKFTGIIRTEYELAKYARELQKQQFPIRFCQFSPQFGFISVEPESVDQALLRFQQKTDGITVTHLSKLQKRILRTKNSIRKRTRKLKRLLGICHYPFSNGDTVITVGQDLGSGDMLDLACIKQKIKLKLHMMSYDIIPITHPQYVNINV